MTKFEEFRNKVNMRKDIEENGNEEIKPFGYDYGGVGYDIYVYPIVIGYEDILIIDYCVEVNETIDGEVVGVDEVYENDSIEEALGKAGICAKCGNKLVDGKCHECGYERDNR